jgi:hypothetical protein
MEIIDRLSKKLHKRLEYSGRFRNASGLSKMCQDLTDDLRQRSNYNKNLLKNVITGDETWVYSYYTETKQQSSCWKNLLLLTQESMTDALASESNAAFFFSIFKALGITNSLLKVRQSRFLSGNSEKSVGSSMKKVT